MKNINIKLVCAATFSSVAGGFMTYRHADHLDSIGGLVLIAFALVCLAPMQLRELVEEGKGAWRAFKNPSA